MKEIAELDTQHEKLDQLSDIVLTSLRNDELDDRIWEHSSWRIDPFTEQRWRDETSVAGQMKHIFDRVDSSTQELLQLAAANSISAWDIEEDSTQLLTESLDTVAVFGASQAIPAMVSIVDNPILYGRPEEEVFEITGDVGAILHGFADIEGIESELKPVLDRWLYDPRLEKVTGQFLGAITECSPQDFAKYFQRVVDVDKKLDGYFMMNAMTDEVVENVDPDIIAAQLEDLSPDAKEILLDAIGSMR